MQDDAPAAARLKNLFGAYTFLIAALAMEFIVFECVARWQGENSFLSPGSLVNIFNRSAVYGVLSVGMTFVILTGGIDLSVGSVVALASVVCALVVKHGGDPVWLWIVVGMGAAMAVGMASGGIAGFVITRFAIPPFIATLALMSTLRGLAYIITDGLPVSPLPIAYTIVGRYRILGIPIAVIVMLAIFTCGAILLNRTRFGRHVRAIGGNEESARLSGVRVARVKWVVYALCGLLAAVGGVLLSSKMGTGEAKSGMAFELGVIAAVVVGGTSLSGGQGSVGGTLLGLLVISVLECGLTWTGVESFGQQVTLGLVIFAAVLIDRFKHRA
ncbi:MAG: ABC transporter permease [bacterium]|nr:ABC transporter permease [bacterium]